MTAFNPSDLHALKDQVIVLTGGALGIGSEVVRLCHVHGAHVFFGDVLEDEGRALEGSLAKTSTPHQCLRYFKTDTVSYADNLALFQAAYECCGRVDHAVSAAAISEKGFIADANLTLESVRDEPKESMRVLDVDLVGPIYFARIASVYLRQAGKGTPTQSRQRTTATSSQPGPSVPPSAIPVNITKSLTLVSSVAGFTETPGLTIYSSAKHGVVGLVRSLRRPLLNPPTSSADASEPVRTNAVCPWMTETRMAHGISNAWKAAGLPANEPIDVARVIAGAMADTSLWGSSLYVEGGRAWNVEAGLDSAMSAWMGKRQAEDFLRGQEVLGMGDGWQSKVDHAKER